MPLGYLSSRTRSISLKDSGTMSMLQTVSPAATGMESSSLSPPPSSRQPTSIFSLSSMLYCRLSRSKSADSRGTVGTPPTSPPPSSTTRKNQLCSPSDPSVSLQIQPSQPGSEGSGRGSGSQDPISKEKDSMQIRVQKRVYKAVFATLGDLGHLSHEALTLGVEFLDLAPVPGLKAAGQLVLGAWNAADQVKNNRRASLRLVERCADLLLSVRLEVSGTGDVIMDELKAPLERLEESFEQIQGFLEKQNEHSFLRRYLYRDEILRGIADLDVNLRDSIGMFHLSVQTRTYNDTQAIKELLNLQNLRGADHQCFLAPSSVKDGDDALALNNSSSSDQCGFVDSSQSPKQLCPDGVIEALHAYQELQNMADAERDKENLREYLRELVHGSDVEIVEAMGIERGEMIAAAKELQQALDIERERKLEKVMEIAGVSFPGRGHPANVRLSSGSGESLRIQSMEGKMDALDVEFMETSIAALRRITCETHMDTGSFPDDQYTRGDRATYSTSSRANSDSSPRLAGLNCGSPRPYAQRRSPTRTSSTGSISSLEDIFRSRRISASRQNMPPLQSYRGITPERGRSTTARSLTGSIDQSVSNPAPRIRSLPPGGTSHSSPGDSTAHRQLNSLLTPTNLGEGGERSRISLPDDISSLSRQLLMGSAIRNGENIVASDCFSGIPVPAVYTLSTESSRSSRTDGFPEIHVYEGAKRMQSNEKTYRLSVEHSFHPSLTLPLWSPSPVELGAVGYLQKQEGAFVTLFNAFRPHVHSHPEVQSLPSVYGYGNVNKGSQTVDRRTIKQKGGDKIVGWLASTKIGDVTSRNTTRRISFPLKAGRKNAILYTELTEYRYVESLDAPKMWFKAHVDTVMHIFGAQHQIQREDLYLVIGTLRAPSYALFVSHSHPDGHADFDVFSSPKRDHPWGAFTTRPLENEGVGPLYKDRADPSTLACAHKVSNNEGRWDSVLLARLRFKPDDSEPTSF